MARAIALMGLGRLGEAKAALLAGMEVSEKAQNATWIRVFRGALAHLKFLAFDFEAALGEAEALQRAGHGTPGQSWTLNTITAGLSELGLGRPKQALQHFELARNGQSGQRSFLDWYWKMLGLFGSSRAHLATGDLPSASRDADLFVQAALSCADRSLQGLALAMQAQVAQAEQRWEDARASLEQALAAMQGVEAPIYAWRVHLSAANLYQAMKDRPAAARHGEHATRLILQLAHSFAPADPQRESLLSAARFIASAHDFRVCLPAIHSERKHSAL